MDGEDPNTVPDDIFEVGLVYDRDGTILRKVKDIKQTTRKGKGSQHAPIDVDKSDESDDESDDASNNITNGKNQAARASTQRSPLRTPSPIFSPYRQRIPEPTPSPRSSSPSPSPLRVTLPTMAKKRPQPDHDDSDSDKDAAAVRTAKRNKPNNSGPDSVAHASPLTTAIPGVDPSTMAAIAAQMVAMLQSGSLPLPTLPRTNVNHGNRRRDFEEGSSKDHNSERTKEKESKKKRRD